MTQTAKNIDISENSLRSRGKVLDILLLDRTSSKIAHRPSNIIWATDSYHYSPTSKIKKEQITGVNDKTIQPRAVKSREEQKRRTKDKAEVFTPLNIVGEMNMAINGAGGNWPTSPENWVDYISELRLEITCGEAPFIASRYDPTKVNPKPVPLDKRVGFLDYKLRELGKYVKSKQDWLKYAEIALKSSYGYEWQGDNLLIARENILQTMDDFYRDFRKNELELKSRQGLSDEQLEYFAGIISWNIWQMDGLKYVIPMSQHKDEKLVKTSKAPKTIQQSFLGLDMGNQEKKQAELFVCRECERKSEKYHNGYQAIITDWSRGGKKGRKVKFVELLNNA